MANAKRALVVDDDDATVALLRKILLAERWEVETFTSSIEAYRGTQPGRFSLVVCDIYMPEMTGVELYERMVKLDPELKRRFVFVSGYTDSSNVKAFLLETGCPGIRKPIRLDEFKAVVAHITEAKPLTATALPARWFTPDSLYLYSGEITGRHTLFSLFNRIYSARLTGVLVLQTGRVEKKLYFNLGQMIFASSNLPGDGLGEVMLREGALTQAQFDAATARMERGQRFGDALVDMGVCTPKRLNEWIREQVTQIATSVFESPAGRYYFFDTFGEDIVPEVGIAVPMGRFLLTAIREADDLPLEELAADENLFVDLSPDPLLRFQDVELNNAERFLLASVTAPVQASEAVRNAGLSPQGGAQALYALLTLGMLMAVPTDTVQTEAAAMPGRATEPSSTPPPPPPQAARPVPPPPAHVPPQPAPPRPAAGPEEFEKEMKRMLQIVEGGTFYQLLGVSPNSDPGHIKKSFYQLARQFHPDRHMGRSDWISSLQNVMEALTTAYRTLSDQKARADYDKRLAESGTFALGREKTARQETAEECLEKAKECLRAKNFAGSITWLRKCVEIAPNESKYRAMLARSLAAVPTYRQDAIEHYEKAIQLDPWNTSAYYQFAELFEEMKLPWRAIPLYKKILDIDPEHTKAREKLRQLETTVDKEKKAEGATLFGRIFAKKP
jgi:CheY-like chemotaxis protein